MPRKFVVLLALALVPTTLAACGSSSGENGKASSKPRTTVAGIQPKDFGGPVDNPYFPLKPGTTYRNVGVEGGHRTVDVFAVTHRTKRILGVTNVVVADKVFSDGKLTESTFDWYTQDRRGNVWYFGEDTRELDRKGKVVSTEGSWEAGVKGARPGIFMPAKPRVGDSFRQEYYKGHAEDHFKVLDLSAPVTVPYGSFRNTLLTREWTPLEPDIVDHKYYVRGIGQVKETTVKGPRETGELVSIKRQP
jgi:hypothetical protein